MMTSHNHGDSPLLPYPSGAITMTLTLALETVDAPSSVAADATPAEIHAPLER